MVKLSAKIVLIFSTRRAIMGETEVERIIMNVKGRILEAENHLGRPLDEDERIMIEKSEDVIKNLKHAIAVVFTVLSTWPDENSENPPLTQGEIAQNMAKNAKCLHDLSTVYQTLNEE